MKRSSMITRLLLLCMFLCTGMLSSFAQKDILLYETDFTNWGMIDGSDASSGDVFKGTGGGDGFSVTGKPTVNPTGTIGGYTGFFVGGNSGTAMTIKPLSYVSGGVVEVWFYINDEGSTRTIELDKPVTQVMMEDLTMEEEADYRNVMAGNTNMAMNDGATGADRETPDPAKLGLWHAGATAKLRYTGFVKVSFNIPSLAGMQDVTIRGMNNGKIHMVALKVYTSVGSAKYVASTNYGNLNNDPSAVAHSMRGTAGGAANSGVAANAAINVKGWNITNGITLSLEGPGSGKFSFAGANPDGTFTISNPDALSSINVPLQFSPSTQAGATAAVLVISDATNPALNYKVALSGITDNGTTNPQLLGSVDVIPFYTSVIAPVSQLYSFAGVYLTADASISFSGPVANRLTVSKASFTALEASKGANLVITYTGTPTASLHDETTSFMIISSGGSELRVPLRLETFEMKPSLHALEFEANPAGTAIINLSLAGPLYPFGSSVEVTVTPEAGYYITGWSDNAGSTSDFRVIRIKPDGTTPNKITVNLAPVGTGGGGGSVGGFTAYTPVNTNDDGFRANWSKNPNESPTTTYTVTVYDNAGTAVGTCTAPAGTYFCDITGLTPSDKSDDVNFMFSYKVEASNLLPADPGATPPLSAPDTETDGIGPFRLTGAVDFTCGR